VPGRGTQDDQVLRRADVKALLEAPVLAEEKLDGASVVLWKADHTIECALRSGAGSQDRGRQLGPLRAWVGERADQLRQLLQTHALYAEWLLLAHAVPYDALPAYLVGLDLWSPNSGFALPDVRNELLARAGVAPPPEVFRGTLGAVERLEKLLGRSRVGSAPMEGVVVRTLDGGEPRIAKLLRADFLRTPDAEWRRRRPRNLLRERELSWH
jgi:RNA ligase